MSMVCGEDTLCLRIARNADGIIVRAWMLWPIARTGNTDGIISRAWMQHGRNHRAGMDALADRTDW